MILGPDGPSSGTLRIPDVLERDAGVYTCRAVNELGDASAEIRLEVGRECTPVPTCPSPLCPASELRGENSTRQPAAVEFASCGPQALGDKGGQREVVCALHLAMSQITPKALWLKTISIHYLSGMEGWDSGSGLAGWLWLRVSQDDSAFAGWGCMVGMSGAGGHTLSLVA